MAFFDESKAHDRIMESLEQSNEMLKQIKEHTDTQKEVILLQKAYIERLTALNQSYLKLIEFYLPKLYKELTCPEQQS